MTSLMLSYTGENPGKEVCLFLLKPVGEF